MRMIQTIAVFIVTVERETSIGDSEVYTDRYKIDFNDAPYPRQETRPEDQPDTVILSEHASSGYAPLETVGVGGIPTDDETSSEDDVVVEIRKRLDDYLNSDEVVDVEIERRSNDIEWGNK